MPATPPIGAELDNALCGGTAVALEIMVSEVMEADILDIVSPDSGVKF